MLCLRLGPSLIDGLGIAMNVQYLTSVGIRPHPNAIDALIRFSDQVVAPRERDVAGFFSGNMSPAWAECYSTAVQAMQLEFFKMISSSLKPGQAGRMQYKLHELRCRGHRCRCDTDQLLPARLDVKQVLLNFILEPGQALIRESPGFRGLGV